ncbi:MAG: hypothetical protein MI799_19615, partial [Desulfobacterales bacterium]|nr:hypothetical protein [Desulfobacterales bacterium]
MRFHRFYVWVVIPVWIMFPCRAWADISGLLSLWQQTDPSGYMSCAPDVEKIKQRQEKQFKAQMDAAFKKEFDAVFGQGLEPSRVYDGMKAVEALTAGDYHAAAKEGGTWVLGIIAPTLNTYVGVVQKTYQLMKAAERIWVKDLYYTDAYFAATQIVDDQMSDSQNPYVPSYLFKFNPGDPKNADIKAVWERMKDRERKMLALWRNNKAAVHQICFHNEWKTRLVSALGKMPTDREVFNHFLYHYTSGGYRERLVKTLNSQYLEPLMISEARAVKKRFSHAMARAVAAGAKAARSAEKEKAQKQVKGQGQGAVTLDPKLVAAKCKQWQAALWVSEYEILNMVPPYQGFVRAKKAFEAEKRQYDALLARMKPHSAKWEALKRTQDRLHDRFEGLKARMKTIDDVPDSQMTQTLVDDYNALRKEALTLAGKGNALTEQMAAIQAEIMPLVERLRPLDKRVLPKQKAWEAFEKQIRAMGKNAGYTAMGHLITPILSDYGFNPDLWNTYYNEAMNK